ncbi:cbb3-type cytochrome c oxidase subunit 3 [Chthonobacter albigriseus]|nr:cbb3-type cytochrome c oxidase subunit 3 [Chthonobacter albigriseus]
MDYQALAAFAQQGGTVYFFLLFCAVIVYACWPRNKAKFDDAARIPFRED